MAGQPKLEDISNTTVTIVVVLAYIVVSFISGVFDVVWRDEMYNMIFLSLRPIRHLIYRIKEMEYRTQVITRFGCNGPKFSITKESRRQTPKPPSVDQISGGGKIFRRKLETRRFISETGSTAIVILNCYYIQKYREGS